MRLLLDTHTVAWWSEDSDRLSPAARQAIDAADAVVFVSAVSVFEMTLKHQLGKWAEGAVLVERLGPLMLEQGFHQLAMTFAHAELAGQLTLTHKDPFDRLLAAQALVDDLTLVSIDDKLDQFGVNRLW